MSKKQTKTPNLAEFIGLTIERINILHSNVGYKTVSICFSNGKSLHLNAELHADGNSVFPTISFCCGRWEMVEAETQEKREVSDGNTRK